MEHPPADAMTEHVANSLLNSKIIKVNFDHVGLSEGQREALAVVLRTAFRRGYRSAVAALTDPE